LERQLARLFAAPWRRKAAVLSGSELDHVRAYNAAHAALRELRELAPGAVDRRRVHDLLAELPVHLGEEPQPDRVQVASPEAELASREAVSAGALEHFADCPVKWLVEDLLKPDALEPDPEQMVRGSYAHAVLQRTYARLREESGDRRVTAANLPLAERIALDE